jgi:DNA-binding response OmpR family regulator
VKTILVVDDEPEIVALCGDYLRASGFAVVTARDGRTALDTLRSSRPDLIVLDLGLPRLDGLEVTRAVRRESAVPIVMLTARADESDTLVGLELGAYDYITKPFSPKELVARVRAVLRRAGGAHAAAELVRAGDVELDVPRMITTVANRRVDLTPTEFRLLLEFARQPGRVFTRSQLLSAVQGVAFESYERAIDAHVKNIRRKIEDDPHRPRRLQTVFGVGYRMAEDEGGRAR